MFIIPAPGRTVRYPGDPSRLLPDTGAEVPDGDIFWRRRLNQGDVVLAQEEGGMEDAPDVSGSEGEKETGTTSSGDEPESVENGVTSGSSPEKPEGENGVSDDGSSAEETEPDSAVVTLSATTGKTKKSGTNTKENKGDD